MVLPLFMAIAPLVILLFGSVGASTGGKSSGGRTKATFYWSSDTLTPTIAAAPTALHSALKATTEYYSLQTEAFAKTNAPWRDQTGNARGSLTGTPTSGSPSAKGSTYEVTISHGMPYGIWLELRRGGHLGIIDRTVQAQAEPYFRTAAQAVAAVLGAR